MTDEARGVIHDSYRLIMLCLVLTVAVFTALYPRTRLDAMEVLSARYLAGLPTWTKLVWTPATYSEMQAARKAGRVREPDLKRGPLDGPLVKLDVFVLGHEDGRVSGFVRRWLYNRNPPRGAGTPSVLKSNEVTFNLPDRQLPGAILGEMRRFDISRSRPFRLAYAACLVGALVLIMLYPYLTPLWRVTRAKEAPRDSSLVEFQRYLLSAMTVAKLKRRAANASTESRRWHGDGWHKHRITWQEVALTLLTISQVSIAVGWYHFINPPNGKAEMHWALDRQEST